MVIKMTKLILIRHGQSIWNKENRFTGWTDVELSEQGIEEAKQAGQLLKKHNINFDIAYTSILKRAEYTLDYILQTTKKEVPIHKSWMLNERHYGALQGMNKDIAKKEFGEEQVHLYRRSATVRPPALDKNDERYPGNDKKYKDLKETELPLTENLNDVQKRVIKYYQENIKKDLKNKKDVLIVAHGNTIRAFMKFFENISDREIMNIEITTGKPYIYELDNDLKIIQKYTL